MNHLLKTCCLVGVVSLLAGEGARADISLYGNLPSNDGGSGLVSSSTWRGITFMTGTEALSVTSVTMRLDNYISSTDTATLTIRAGTSSAPSTILSTLVAPSSGSNAAGDFVFTTTSALTLTTNTLYWIVISAANNTDTFEWVRSNPSVEPTSTVGVTSGTQKISDNGDSGWQTGNDGPHSFQITGDVVPEPAAFALVGLGLAALGYQARRRAAQSRN